MSPIQTALELEERTKSISKRKSSHQGKSEKQMLSGVEFSGPVRFLIDGGRQEDAEFLLDRLNENPWLTEAFVKAKRTGVRIFFGWGRKKFRVLPGVVWIPRFAKDEAIIAFLK